MAPPSKNFTIIADSAIDPDSPITTDLMTDFRDNDIHLEEWLGHSYTAAQDHDHDGTNSARITLSAYNGQLSAVGGAGWSVSTGSLGFDPQALSLTWAWSFPATNFNVTGIGYAIGTGGAGDQCGISYYFYYSPPTTYEWRSMAMDSAHVMGYDLVYSNSPLNIGFSTEYADVTAFSSSGVTIATQTGSWGGTLSVYINLQIWGS